MNSKNLSSSDRSASGFGKLILVGLAAGFAATVVKTLCEIIPRRARPASHLR